MLARMKHSYTIFADYHQFYLWDKKVEPDAPTNYTDEDVQKRIKAAPNVVVIQPERNMDVPVEVEVFESAPPLELVAWDHVAEASLELPSGVLEIHECTGGSIDEIQLAPGTYRVRACYGKLSELSKYGLEGNDHYRLELWPAPFASVEVLKQFGGNDAD
jgi:hypothetical protein